jgi:hypothetical protein
MRLRSVFELVCICGAECVTEERWGLCAGCGRAYELVWPAPIVGGKPVERRPVWDS